LLFTYHAYYWPLKWYLYKSINAKQDIESKETIKNEVGNSLASEAFITSAFPRSEHIAEMTAATTMISRSQASGS
jgi:hypothetical protein